MTTLSIIIPIYNTEQYLSKCLESVIGQTFKDIEIICVNDGSTDNSLAVLEEHAKKDSRILIINKKNGGISSARNAGLDAAKGKYIGFVDSDDFIEAGTYETAISRMGEDIDIVCYGTNILGANHHINIRDADEEYYRIKFAGKVTLDDNVRLKTDVATCDKLYKKSIIDAYNLRFPVGMHYEDYSFYFQYMSVVNVAYFEPIKFYNYQRRSGSIMRNTFERKSPRAMEHLYAVKFIYDFWVKNNILEQNIPVLPHIFENCFYFAYAYVPKKLRANALKEATMLVKKMNLLELYPDFGLIRHLHRGKYDKINGVNYYTFGQRLFSIKNKDRYKVFCFLGIKIKKLRHEEVHRELQNKLLGIQNELLNMQKVLCKQIKFDVDKSTLLLRLDITAAKLHQETFAKYKNAFAGKDVVLLATGPTLTKFKPIENAIYVGVNSAFKYDKVKIDYMFFTDYCGLSYLEEVNNYPATKFYGIVRNFYTANGKSPVIPESIAIRHGALRYYENAANDWKIMEDLDFAYDLTTTPLTNYCSITFPAMQFILWCNPRRIYLVGCDTSNSGYFDGTTNSLTVDMVMRGWLKMKDFVQTYYPEIEIISINPVGLEGLFKDIYTKL